jgi:hypothetical protein
MEETAEPQPRVFLTCYYRFFLMNASFSGSGLWIRPRYYNSAEKEQTQLTPNMFSRRSRPRMIPLLLHVFTTIHQHAGGWEIVESSDPTSWIVILSTLAKTKKETQITDNQFGFMFGRSTTEVIYLLQRVMEISDG